MNAIDIISALVEDLKLKINDIEHKAVRGADFEKVLRFQGEVRGLETAITLLEEYAKRLMDE